MYVRTCNVSEWSRGNQQNNNNKKKNNNKNSKSNFVYTKENARNTDRFEINQFYHVLRSNACVNACAK